TFDCRNLLCVMNDDQPMRGAPKYAARLLVGGRAAGARGQSLVVTPFHFSESTVKSSSFSASSVRVELSSSIGSGSAAFPAAEADAESVAGGAPDRSAPPSSSATGVRLLASPCASPSGIWTLSAAVSLVAAPPVERSSYIFFQFLWLVACQQEYTLIECPRIRHRRLCVLLMLALSVTFYRRFVGDPNVENDHPDGARKFLVLHKASRECLDKQAVETVCRTLEEMVSDSMKGLSSMEIWAYEVVHLQKLRELGYKLLEFLDDLKRDTRDSHNLAPTQVLTDVAMTLVLEREVRCLTNRDKEVPVHAFSAFQPERRRPVSIGIQQSMAQVPTRLTDVGPAGHPERHGLNYAAANTQLLSWARHIRKYQRAFLASTSNRASHIHAG
uniref:Cyclin N-terminal domain-containing protein n=1 Tax=Macrostomum lignano TaxID=282301 RepID=A0A1I8JPG1_9PLAT